VLYLIFNTEKNKKSWMENLSIPLSNTMGIPQVVDGNGGGDGDDDGSSKAFQLPPPHKCASIMPYINQLSPPTTTQPPPNLHHVCVCICVSV